jgi:hypothetical protein
MSCPSPRILRKIGGGDRPMHEPPSIPEEQLRACVQDQYALSAVTLEFLPLGLDTRAGVYRVVSEQGTPYLLKAKSGSLYEPSCLVPRYLREQGVAAVVDPLPTRRRTLWTQLGEWMVIVYPDELGDATKADAVTLLHAIFSEGGEADRALADAAHLPTDLNFHNRDRS